MSTAPAEKIVAVVNLARLVVERAGLDLIEIVQRSVGLQSFMRDKSDRTDRARSGDLSPPARARSRPHRGRGMAAVTRGRCI